MIYGFDRPGEQPEEIGALTIDVRTRVLNCSASGCLVETVRPLSVGTIARLFVNLSQGAFEEVVQIVRCQEIAGGAGVYHLGTEFVTTSPPSVESLRYLIRREGGALNAWLQPSPTVP